MMTPEMMANEIVQAFSMCRKSKRMSHAALADEVGCGVDMIKRIEASDFDTCFALRAKYTDPASVERRPCDAIGLTPRLCRVLVDVVVSDELFSFYFTVGKGWRRTDSRAERDARWDESSCGENVCERCGYRPSQHSDEGWCPDYGE